MFETRICARCGARLFPDRLQCLACRHWNVTRDAEPVGPRVVNLASAEIVPAERFTSGPWDASLGGGFVRTGAYLLGGPPGSGKTTLSLAACDALARKTMRPPLYIAAEQSLGEIRANVERMGLDTEAFLMFEAMHYRASFEAPAILSAMIREVCPVAVIVDSLPEFAGKNETLADRLLHSLKEDAVIMRCPVLVLAHVTKDLEIGGLMSHQHVVDAVGIVEHDTKTDRRTLRWRKNRFGSTRTAFAFDMGPQGIEPVAAEDERPT